MAFRPDGILLALARHRPGRTAGDAQSDVLSSFASAGPPSRRPGSSRPGRPPQPAPAADGTVAERFGASQPALLTGASFTPPRAWPSCGGIHRRDLFSGARWIPPQGGQERRESGLKALLRVVGQVLELVDQVQRLAGGERVRIQV